MYIGDDSQSDAQSLFITERHTFTDLMEGLASPCPCGMTRNPWMLESLTQVHLHTQAFFACHGLLHEHARQHISLVRVAILLYVLCIYVHHNTIQKGHVLRALFRCQRCHKQQRTWSSSRVVGGHYLVNQKYVTCRTHH